MSTTNQRLAEWKRSSASRAKEAIDAAKEAKKLALRTCKLAEDLFKGIEQSAGRLAGEIRRDGEGDDSDEDTDDDYDRDNEIAADLGDLSFGVSDHTEDAKHQLESIFDTLIEGLEEAAKSIKGVGST